MTTRADIVAEAMRWEGRPFRHQGRAWTGVDCAGLVIMVAKELGLSTYDKTDYGRRAEGVEFLREFVREMGPQRELEDARPGDVLLFRDGRFVTHAAIVLDPRPRLKIIHAYGPHRRVSVCYPDTVRDSQGILGDRITHCFAYPGVED